MSILARLTNADGSVTATAAFAANPDGSPPLLIGVTTIAAALFARSDDTRRVLGTGTDWFALTGTGSGTGSGTDADLSQPGVGSPGLANPGDPGAALAQVIYAYSYVYSAPVLTPVGEK